MSHEDYDHWLEAARQVSPKSRGLPIPVLLTEAIQTAKFFETYWEPGDGLHGLKSAGKRLPQQTGEELLSLHNAAQEAQSRYLMSIQPRASVKAALKRGKFILSEVTAVLEWVLDDDQQEPYRKLAAIAVAHADDSDSAADTAQAIHDYCTLANTMRERLDGVGGFDAALIDEGFELTATLGAVGSWTPPQEIRAAQKVRDQMLTLLKERMGLVRSAARFVFRGRADIIQQATSAYERRKRAERRRKRLQAENR